MGEGTSHNIISQLALGDGLEALAALGGGVLKGSGDVGLSWGGRLQGGTIGREVQVTLCSVWSVEPLSSSQPSTERWPLIDTSM